MVNYDKITEVADQPTPPPTAPPPVFQVATYNKNADQPLTLAPTISTAPVGVMLLGPGKSTTTCPFCNIAVETTVKFYATARTHIAAALCLSICCCCIPYCSNSAKDTVHYCPVCKNYLGTYKK